MAPARTCLDGSSRMRWSRSTSGRPRRYESAFSSTLKRPSAEGDSRGEEQGAGCRSVRTCSKAGAATREGAQPSGIGALPHRAVARLRTPNVQGVGRRTTRWSSAARRARRDGRTALVPVVWHTSAARPHANRGPAQPYPQGSTTTNEGQCVSAPASVVAPGMEWTRRSIVARAVDAPAGETTGRPAVSERKP